MIELGAFLKLLLYVSLIACVFFPFGLARDGLDPGAYAAAAGLYVAKLAAAGVMLAVFETSIAKMRVFMVPGFLGAALLGRDVGGEVELVVETRWASPEAVARFAGQRVTVTLHEPRDGRRHFEGLLLEPQGSRTLVRTDEGQVHEFEWAEVRSARLVVDPWAESKKRAHGETPAGRDDAGHVDHPRGGAG